MNRESRATHWDQWQLRAQDQLQGGPGQGQHQCENYLPTACMWPVPWNLGNRMLSWEAGTEKGSGIWRWCEQGNLKKGRRKLCGSSMKTVTAHKNHKVAVTSAMTTDHRCLRLCSYLDSIILFLLLGAKSVFLHECSHRLRSLEGTLLPPPWLTHHHRCQTNGDLHGTALNRLLPSSHASYSRTCLGCLCLFGRKAFDPYLLWPLAHLTLM
jgi:hypothetical protein